MAITQQHNKDRVQFVLVGSVDVVKIIKAMPNTPTRRMVIDRNLSRLKRNLNQFITMQQDLENGSPIIGNFDEFTNADFDYIIRTTSECIGELTMLLKESV